MIDRQMNHIIADGVELPIRKEYTYMLAGILRKDKTIRWQRIIIY